MKKKIIVASMSLCILLASATTSFADAGQAYKAEVPSVNPVVGKSVVPRSSGITLYKATRVSTDYLRIVFSNSKNYDITATFYIMDGPGMAEVISGAHTITVPRNGVFTADYYIGGHQSGVLSFEGPYGEFNWPKK